MHTTPYTHASGPGAAARRRESESTGVGVLAPSGAHQADQQHQSAMTSGSFHVKTTPGRLILDTQPSAVWGGLHARYHADVLHRCYRTSSRSSFSSKPPAPRIGNFTTSVHTTGKEMGLAKRGHKKSKDAHPTSGAPAQNRRSVVAGNRLRPAKKKTPRLRRGGRQKAAYGVFPDARL